MDLRDKVVVVTGASQGLGKELSIFLSQEKAKIAIVARSENELLHVKREITDNGAECESFICDITKLEDIKKTTDAIINKFGRIDVLVNNAGVWKGDKFEDEKAENIQNLFAVNILGPIFFCHTVLPFMRTQNSGQILNIISIAGVETPGSSGTYSVYTSTKYALRGFTDSLEEELKDTNIKIMGFYPGGMATNIMKAAGYNYEIDKSVVMDTKDVVKILLFMLSQPDDVLIDHLVVRKRGQTPK